MEQHPRSLEAYHLLHEGTLALANAERNGIRVDMEYVENKYNHMTRQMARKERQFEESQFYADWKASQEKEPNLNSGPQLANFLYEVKKLKPPKLTPSGRGSTDKDSLAALNIPELNKILEVRKLKKIRDYLEAFRREQVNGWLHPFFNLHLVVTYRSSADRPNFQNIPKRDKEAMTITRKALYPRPGNQLLEVDYSGLEVRIAACYHKDPVMLKYIDTGYDMHADMAAQIFMIDDFDKHKPEHAYLRAATKNGFVFPQFYGDYFGNCAEYLAVEWGKLPAGKWTYDQGVMVEEERTLAKHLIGKGIHTYQMFVDHLKAIEEDFWGKRFKHYARWKERHWHQYQKTGYVDLHTGFRCRGFMTKNDAINYPVQGAAFHCLLWAFIQLNKFLTTYKWKSRVIGQIHDAIVLDVDPKELNSVIGHIKKITTEDLPKAWDWINVPLDVDFEVCPVDGSWAEKKELSL